MSRRPLGLLIAASLVACSPSPPSRSSLVTPVGLGRLGSNFPVDGMSATIPPGIRLNPGVVVIHDGVKAIRSISADHTRYVLDASADGVGRLGSGMVMLIPGVEAGRVIATTRQGDGVEVRLGPALITDVIHDGHLAWHKVRPKPNQIFASINPSFDQAAPPGAPAPASPSPTAATVSFGAPPAAPAPHHTLGDARLVAFVQGDGACGGAAASPAKPTSGGSPPTFAEGGDSSGTPSPSTSTAPTAAAPGGTSNEVTLNLGKWKVSINPAYNSTSGTLDLSIAGRYNLSSSREGRFISGLPSAPNYSEDNGLEVGLNASLHLAGFEPSGSIDVSNGKVSDYQFDVPMNGCATLEFAARSSAGSKFPKSAIIKVPINFSWPVYGFGIPMYVSVGASFLAQPSFATKDSGIDVKARLNFSGGTAVSSKGSGVSASGLPQFQPPDNPMDGSDASRSVGSIASLVAFQLPRVAIGVGTLSAFTAKAGAFVDLVSSLSATQAGAVSMIPCSAVTLSAAGHAGVEWELSISGVGGLSKIGVEGEVTHEIYTKSKTWFSPNLKICQPGAGP